jgi:hypothetical protein
MLDQDQAPVQRPGHHDRAGIAEAVGKRVVDYSWFGERHRPQTRAESRSGTGHVRDRVQQPVTRGQG